ncbi:response regulator [Brevibacillus sp. H7]|uniref:response regulator n=1 Tax=Brevibacillus sp. H7 TaxID=3349138 RepID=UPI0038079776
MVQEVNRQFIESVPGFEVVGMAGNGAEGVKLVKALKPDLVVIDIFMPALDGVQTIQQLRSDNEAVDVIVITAAKDKATIQTMLRHGAMDYIIKPFKLERIQQALENYRSFRIQLQQEGTVSQTEVDLLLLRRKTSAGSPSVAEELPKGLNALTLQQVIQYLTQQNRSLSAEEVAEQVGIARVTARRYLEYLEKSGTVHRAIEYGGVGRPTNRYVFVKN